MKIIFSSELFGLRNLNIINVGYNGKGHENSGSLIPNYYIASTIDHNECKVNVMSDVTRY